MIRFTIPCSPVAQPRGRACVIPQNGKPQARIYEAPKTHAIHAFKATCRLAASQHLPATPTAKPVILSLVFVFPRNKDQQRKKWSQGRLRHTKAPDCDNCAKSVMDALNLLAWLDDAQVHCLQVEKWIAASDEQPHVEVTIQELPE